MKHEVWPCEDVILAAAVLAQHPRGCEGFFLEPEAVFHGRQLSKIYPSPSVAQSPFLFFWIRPCHAEFCMSRDHTSSKAKTFSPFPCCILILYTHYWICLVCSSKLVPVITSAIFEDSQSGRLLWPTIYLYR